MSASGADSIEGNQLIRDVMTIEGSSPSAVEAIDNAKNFLADRLTNNPISGVSIEEANKIKNADQVLLFEEWSSLTDPGKTLFNFLNREFRFQKTTSFYENFKVHQYIK